MKCPQRINVLSGFQKAPGIQTPSQVDGHGLSRALLVAEIPVDCRYEQSEIDFVTFKHAQLKTTDDLMVHFRENVSKVGMHYEVTDADMEKHFISAQAAKIFHVKF